MSIKPLNDSSLAEAVALLDAGSLVALPTETVYGLAADSYNGRAVAEIFAAKGRPKFNPLIAHVSDLMMAEHYVEIDPLSRHLMKVFWPGALTLVLQQKKPHSIHPLATAGLASVAIRCPCGGLRAAVARLGRPLVAPSANRSGQLSPTSAAAVFASLGKNAPLILDGGSTKIGVESTIIKVVEGQIFLLRPGGVTTEMLEEVSGTAVQRSNQCTAIEAPGMLESHYAPKATLRLNAVCVEAGEAFLGFGSMVPEGIQQALSFMNLSVDGVLPEAASNLFAALFALDRMGAKRIAVAPIPMAGLGEAINDRLQRAAAPRSVRR